MKPTFRIATAFLAAALLPTGALSAATITWDGGSSGPGDNNWSTAANWAGDVAPVSGTDIVVFNAAGIAARPSPNVDAAWTLPVNPLGGYYNASLLFTAGGCTLGGSDITLNVSTQGGRTVMTDFSGVGTTTINNNFTMASKGGFFAGGGTMVLNGNINMGASGGNDTSFNVSNKYIVGGTRLEVNGILSGASGLPRVGTSNSDISGSGRTGTVVFTNANTFSGNMQVGATAGTTKILVLFNNTTGSGSGTGSLLIDRGGLVGGTGTIGAVNCGSSTSTGGAFSPGDGGIGTLHCGTVNSYNTAAADPWLFDLGAGNTSDLLAITGNFYKSGTGIKFDFGGSTATGTFTLVTWTAAMGFTASDFSFTNLGGAGVGYFSIVGKSLRFTTGTQTGGTYTWDGGGVDENWGTAANWAPDGVPLNDPDVRIIFAGSVRTSPVNTIPWSIGTSDDSQPALSFAAGSASRTLSGSPITIKGTVYSAANVLNASGNAQTISNDLVLTNANGTGISTSGAGKLVLNGNIDGTTTRTAFITANNATGDIEVNGIISGAGAGTPPNNQSLSTSGTQAGATITLAGINTYTGSSQLSGGVIKLTHDALVSTPGSLGNSAGNVIVGSGSYAANSVVSVLTKGAVTVGRVLWVRSGGHDNADTTTATIGGSTADVSTFSGNIQMGDNLNPGNCRGTPLFLTAASGGTVNFTGNLLKMGTPTDLSASVTKIGDGKVVLSGTNTYNGDTTVNKGILSLHKASGAYNLDDASNVIINHDGSTTTGVLDLDFTGTDQVASVTINGVTVNNGIFDASHPSGFFTGTGTLQAGSGVTNNYSTWAAVNGIEGQPASGDYDNDGLTNLMEYALVQNGSDDPLDPTVSAPLANIYSDSAHQIMFTKNPQAVSNNDVTYIIEVCTDLNSWTEAPAGPDYVNSDSAISYVLPAGLARKFARLKLTQTTP